MIMRKKDYAEYCEACGTNGHRFTFEEATALLERLVGKTVRATDGFANYRVSRSGVRPYSTLLGKSMWSGLVGWVAKPSELVDLLEELYVCEDIEEALWCVGMNTV